MARHWWIGLWIAGCGAKASGDEHSSPAEGSSSSGTDVVGSSDDGTEPSSGTETGATSAAATEGNDTCSFINCGGEDTGPPPDCDLWSAGDCGPGMKCAPWADDGGSSWNAAHCVPIVAQPKQPGDPCTADGGGVSGFDDCDEQSMCWDIDPDTGLGTCLAYCEGSAANPSCAEPGETCVINNEGALILCLPTCDPTLAECPPGSGCYPAPGGLDFVCVFDAGGEAGAFGDPCEFGNFCDPGSWCAPAEVVPACTGSQGCCSSFCVLGEANDCPGATDGQECLPWYQENQAPPGFEHVGTCALP